MRSKHLYQVLLMLILGLAVLIILALDQDYNSSLISTIECTVRNSLSDKTISVWFSEKDKIYYVFLPTYSELKQVNISYAEGYELYLNDQRYKEGDLLTGIELNTSYDTTFYQKDKVQDKGILIFMKSQNTAAVYLSTITGSMKFVDSNKNNKEAGEITIITPEGGLDYSGDLTYVKGRGNTTWNYDKKPYHIELSKKADLLQLGSANTWYLLGNYNDETNLRNILAYDFAEDIGLEFSPDSKLVDLYLNHKYMGLYLLTEKIEIAEHRVEIGEKGVLLEFEADRSRFEKEPYGFVTKNGQMIIIHNEKALSDEAFTRIQLRIQEVEDALLSPDGRNHNTGKYYYEYMDVNSWARKYIVDEVFANYDCQWSSQFFVMKENGQLSAGPVWDYDLTLGKSLNMQTAPDAISFAYGWREYRYSTYIKCYDYLYQRQDFYDLLVSIYQNDVQPVLQMYGKEIIPDYMSSVKAASIMNAVRWDFEEVNKSNEELTDYLQRHSSFLTDVWVNNIIYHKVYFVSKSGWDLVYSYAVKSGESIGKVPIPYLSNYTFEGWYDNKTQEEFVYTDQITMDTVVYAKWSQTQIAGLRSFLRRYYEAVPVLVLAVFMAAFLVFDRKKHHPGYEHPSKMALKTTIKTGE